MVVGESGLGKSTLVNSLFLTDLYPERVIPDAVGNANAQFFRRRKHFILNPSFCYRKTKANCEIRCINS